jgi:hypothetical protein
MVRLKPWTKNGKAGFEVDIPGRLPDGTKYRERVKAPVSTRTAALAWAQRREAEIIAQGGREAPERPAERQPAPTLAAFWDRFKQGHVDASGLKPSYKSTVATLYQCHLKPALGARHHRPRSYPPVQGEAPGDALAKIREQRPDPALERAPSRR